jgi:hypothetical protein
MSLYTTCPVQRGSAGAATFLSPDARKRANEVGGAVAPFGDVDSAAQSMPLSMLVAAFQAAWMGPSYPRPAARAKKNTIMDEDLDQLSREELLAEIKRLRAGIREHRDSTKHELCWHHPQLWGLLPEKVAPDIAVPAWPQFLRGCLKYRESLDAQAPDAPRATDEFGGKNA